MKKIVSIEGMSCEHCVNAVKGALEALSGVKSAKVELKKKSATVKLSDSVDDGDIRSAVENAGFTVVDITTK